MSYKVYNKKLNMMECTARLKVGGTYMFEKDEADRIATVEGATYDENKDCFICDGERFYGVDACSHQKKFFHVYPMGHMEDWNLEKKIQDSIERSELLKTLEARRDEILKEFFRTSASEETVLGEIKDLLIIAEQFNFYKFCRRLRWYEEYISLLPYYRKEYL